MQNPKSMTGLPYFFSDALRVSAFLTAALSWTIDAVGIGVARPSGAGDTGQPATGEGGDSAKGSGKTCGADGAETGGTSCTVGGGGIFVMSVMVRFLDDRDMAPKIVI